MNALKYFGLASSIAALTVGANIASAQSKAPSTTEKPAALHRSTTGRQQRYIRVRNLQPSVIAWWLQPELHPEPMAFAQSRENARRFLGIEKNPKPEPLFALPAGLMALVPLNSQNALLVIGSEDAIAAVEKFVTALDRPLRQVEVEAQIIQFEHADDLAALGIAASGGGGAQMGVVKRPRAEFRAELSRLVEAKRAKVLNSPRMTAINNLTAALWTATGNPALIVPDTEGRVAIVPDAAKDGEETKPPAATLKRSLELADTFGVAVTPTINSDDTVTLVLQVGRTVRLQDRQSGDSVRLYSPSSIQTVAQVRDGDTIALGGLTAQVVPAQSTSDAANSSTIQTPQPQNSTTKTVIVLVTTRILRRLDEAGESKVVTVPVPNQERREAIAREATRRALAEKATP